MELNFEERELVSKALFLARRAMHTAFFWNNHNFEPAHKMDRDECVRQGIADPNQAQKILGEMTVLHQRIVHEKD